MRDDILRRRSGAPRTVVPDGRGQAKQRLDLLGARYTLSRVAQAMKRRGQSQGAKRWHNRSRKARRRRRHTWPQVGVSREVFERSLRRAMAGASELEIKAMLWYATESLERHGGLLVARHPPPWLINLPPRVLGPL